MNEKRHRAKIARNKKRRAQIKKAYWKFKTSKGRTVYESMRVLKRLRKINKDTVKDILKRKLTNRGYIFK